ncbi:hypothetical protein BK764_23060 [Bacillus thuringiensis serovar israelensis]|nr:hypothetical protein ATN07_21245 [Bacillus thuringiensis serovar israelensis]EXL37409.1 hypothetical protein BG78_22435 [Bacillus thuringiensis serovar israelensis]OTX58412.1 hypothetical protein BK719_36030 [Bacillus thuringiensis serovar novosibirsk]OTZ51632.1 hypothetical protein BK764_23060 [Bacillus thuringiensis serovar israelensis]
MQGRFFIQSFPHHIEEPTITGNLSKNSKIQKEIYNIGEFYIKKSYFTLLRRGKQWFQKLSLFF